MNIDSNTAFTLNWTFLDANKQPVNNLDVSATLYSNRSRMDPEVTPGVPVVGLTNVSYTAVDGISGIYQANVLPISTEEMPPGGNYILVIEATFTGVLVYHKEIPGNIQVGN